MFNTILATIAIVISALGFTGNRVELWDKMPLNFGSTNFPTSLDSLTNPAAGDSVATVSHSAQHANANDAIEALEAKVRIDGDTTGGYLFGSNGTNSGWTSWATTTRITTTNLLATGSSTLQLLTSGTTTVHGNFLTDNATTTNLFVSNLASTTELRSNSATIGNSTIGNLSVTTCTGCSSGAGVTIYTATTTSARYMAKTLNLVAGDTVIFSTSESAGNPNQGSMIYRISSPWSMASTTIVSGQGNTTVGPIAATWTITATTTSTYTFSFQPGDSGDFGAMTLILQNNGFGNNF